MTSPPGMDPLAPPQPPEEAPDCGRRRAFLLYCVPLLLMFLAVVALPLLRGSKTLILRDVLNSHLPMKWSQALSLRAGTFPLLDPYRAGGQPIAGNPNAVPFYPDNLLYLFASPLWSLNAHFWIHLLLAPLAFYPLARAWGLRRAPSWAGATCYAASGFFLSHLNFYNLVAGAALAPLLATLVLRIVRWPARMGLVTPAVALVWALLLVAGDPQTALLSLLLAVSAGWTFRRSVPPGEGWRRLALLAAAFACGCLLALPQLVAFLRILPGSYRGRQGYSASAVLTSSWDPRQAVDWFLPWLFGRPDAIHLGSFWGQKFFSGVPPYFLSLYPGLLCLALLAAAGLRRQRADLWCWGAIGSGIFLALGQFNPLGHWLFVTATHKALRYPVKFWLLVAIGASLLAALGFDRLLRREGGAERRFRAMLLLLGALLAGLWVYLTLARRSAEALLAYLIPRSAPFIAHERMRWAGLAAASLAILALLAGAFWLRRRSVLLSGALLLAFHAGSQLYLLRPLYAMDATVPYQVPPPALALIPPGARVANPDFNHLLGPSSLVNGKFPQNHTRWLERRSAYELYPFTAPRWKRRYELNCSPEGLDSYFAREAQNALRDAGDRERQTRMLAAWGVSRLLLNHPLEPLPGHARLLAQIPSFGSSQYVYEIVAGAPEVFLARTVFREPTLKEVFRRLGDATFDPQTDAALIGPASPPQPTAGGEARVLKRQAEDWTIATDAGPFGSLLVVQLSDGLFEATIDGRPAPIATTNGYRIGIQVPEGRHLVRLFVDRRPFHQSLLGALLGLLTLPLLALRGREAERSAEAAVRSDSPEPPESPESSEKSEPSEPSDALLR